MRWTAFFAHSTWTRPTGPTRSRAASESAIPAGRRCGSASSWSISRAPSVLSPRWSRMIVDRPSTSGPAVRAAAIGRTSSGPVIAMNGVAWSRRLPVGAELAPDGGVHFRAWAPRRRRVEVVFQDAPSWVAPALLSPELDGYFSGHVVDAVAGLRYRFRLDDDDTLYPDPASRFQPAGPHGPSETIDPSAFNWTDGGWRGAELRGQVLYELHVGTFTVEGTWSAAA